MRVLWIVNTMFPYPAKQTNNTVSCFGGWAHSLYDSLNKNKEIEFCIVSTYPGEKLEKYKDSNTTYYLIPNKKENKYNHKLKKYWKNIIEDFQPDIVHIHGTEYPKSLPLIDIYPNLNYVVSIQGFLNSYKRLVNCNLSFFTLLKNITLRDILKPKTGLLMSSDMNNRAKYEKIIIEKVNNVIGRTTWDKAQVLAINPKLNYYHCEENLRANFYKDQWNINQIEKYTLFFSQAQSPIKGFYIIIDALKILKNKYPNIKIYVAGNNIIDKSFVGSLKRQSYAKYLKKQIRKYNLENNIQFTGYLDAENYKNTLLKSHVYVQASSIENSSNSLGEAMILGMPCVASNVGGTNDMLIDGKEGYLYQYTEPELLAYYVDKFFQDDRLCDEKGLMARKHALERHNWDENAKQTLKVYKDILKRGN